MKNKNKKNYPNGYLDSILAEEQERKEKDHNWSNMIRNVKPVTFEKKKEKETEEKVHKHEPIKVE